MAYAKVLDALRTVCTPHLAQVLADSLDDTIDALIDEAVAEEAEKRDTIVKSVELAFTMLDNPILAHDRAFGMQVLKEILDNEL